MRSWLPEAAQMTSVLFVGRTASGLVRIYVGRADDQGRLCDWFASGIPTLKTDSSDHGTLVKLALSMAAEYFPHRADLEGYVRTIKSSSWGRYGVAASKKESPTRVVDLDIDPWSRAS